MRTWVFVLVAVVAILVPVYSFAQINSGLLRIDLAEDKVSITTGFNGARLALFGLKKQQGDLAVVVKGPERRTVVRRKDQVMGIWANRETMHFRNVPVYYDLALSKAEHALADMSVLRKNGIGLDALDFAPVVRGKTKESTHRFKEALIRNKQKQGHFPLEPKNISFIDEDFFRVDFKMPADVPTGEYLIHTFLLRDGEVIDLNETRLRVAQVGFSAGLYRFAHLQSVLYGIVAVLLALAAGFGANFFLRRE